MNEAIPTTVILKCQHCGEEKFEKSTNNSFFLDADTLQRYECGVRECYCHTCNDGTIGVFHISGMRIK